MASYDLSTPPAPLIPGKPAARSPVIETKLPFSRTNASVLLDLLRGLSAFVIVIGHGRNFLFADYNQLPAHPIWISIPYLITKAGHQAVMIFFVLSGYLISGSIFRSVRNGTWSWPSYLTHRLVRLWVVLLPGLLLCALWDHIALTHHLAPALYRFGANNHMSVDVASRHTPIVFLQNIFFLQVSVAKPFGSDTALWSLAYEFWFYILFPLGLFTFARQTRMRPRILNAVLLVVIAWFGRVYLPLFPIWLAGALLAVMPTLPLRAAARWIATGLYVSFFLFCASNLIRVWYIDYLLAIATFFFIWILLSATGNAKPSLRIRATREFARFSYTSYVVHAPFLLFITALLLGEDRWQPTLINFLKASGVIAIVLAYAYAVASVTEFHTDTLRRWIERRWKLLRPISLPNPAWNPRPGALDS
jgi:peptidoglycan/LPS O-acetylase OafA/YrhL